MTMLRTEVRPASATEQVALASMVVTRLVSVEPAMTRADITSAIRKEVKGDGTNACSASCFFFFSAFLQVSSWMYVKLEGYLTLDIQCQIPI